VFYPMAVETAGYMAPPADRTGQGDRKTHHHHHWRSKRDGVSVSAAVRGTTNKFIGNYRNSDNDLCKFLCTS